MAPTEDRDTSPFYHRDDITSVTPLEKAYGGKRTGSATIGATVVFRAVPGLTAEWLQHEVNCHLARASAAGHQMPEMDYCPLALKGAKATVSSAGDGFAVAVSSDDAATSAEIWKRAQALTSSANAPSGPSASK